MVGIFTRRPLQVEAWQNDDAGPAMPAWLQRIGKRQAPGRIVFPNQSIPAAELGDWIVLHPDGHIAIMAAGAFEFEYAPAPQLPRDLNTGIVGLGVDLGAPEGDRRG